MKTKGTKAIGVVFASCAAALIVAVLATAVLRTGRRSEGPAPGIAAATAESTETYLAGEGKPVARFEEITDALLHIEPGSASAHDDCLATQQALNAEVDPTTLVEKIASVPDAELAELWLNDQAARIDTLSPCLDSDWAAMNKSLSAVRQLAPLISARHAEVRSQRPKK